LWANLLEAVGRASAFTRSYLADAQPISLAKGVLTIGFDPEFADQMDLVNNSKTHTLLQTKLQELGHPSTQIKFIKSEQPLPRAKPQAAPASAPSTPATTARDAAPSGSANDSAAPPPSTPKKERGEMNAEDFKNDPLIQKALEMFKGQIVDVRT
jgi:hypothetical protein